MASDPALTASPGRWATLVAALQHGMWRIRGGLSSGLSRAESFLETAGFDRAPWLAVGFGGGIALWFVLPGKWQWLAALALCLSLALGVAAALREEGRWPLIRIASMTMAAMVAAGLGLVWAKSAMVGAPAIARPLVAPFEATVLAREEQPAEDRVRLVLATREPGSGRAIRVRVNLKLADDAPGIAEGAKVRLRARLMPPAAPMLPGGYDFARASWFTGLAATGSVLGKVEVVAPAHRGGWARSAQRALSEHVRARLSGSPGAIAAAFASGDRGAIGEADDTAMRDAGLTHLLSVSGLHVSAVVAAAYFLAIKLLALWPWLALRVRLQLVAAGAGALAGVGYTLLTGAEVPTVRSCIGAILVLAALALGREPLSLRMLAVGALLVMLVWPEAVIGPSFQMSFGAVLAIVALHGSGPVRAFLAPREEAWWQRGVRLLAMMVLTGVVIELALLPIGLFHFHRAGVYGALANVIAIPLTTFVTMPLIALALLFDAVGAGGPVWWLAGQSLELLLGLAHWTAARPGAVTLLPAAGTGAFALFIGGALWLALWRGRVRLFGLVPALVGTALLATARPPDVLVSGDGQHVGIVGEAAGTLLVLREGKSDYARDTLLELAGMNGTSKALADWPGAMCNRDVCTIVLKRGARDWHMLVTRGRDRLEERALAASCDRADIVVSQRWLPRSCHPRVLKADRTMLERSGGLALDLTNGRVSSVASSQGEHGWWRLPEPRVWPKRPSPANASPAQ